MRNSMRLPGIALLVAASFPGGARSRAEVRGPLAGLPGAPGPHIEKIKARKDDTWLRLGSPGHRPDTASPLTPRRRIRSM
jgi:hypothetical protein